MSSFVPLVRLFLLTACAFPSFAVSVVAQDPATPPATVQPQAAGSAAEIVIENGRKYRIETRIVEKTESTMFVEFIEQIGWEERRFKRETEEHKDPVSPKTDYSKVMNIREDECQDMLRIFLEAYRQVGEANRLFEEMHHETDEVRFARLMTGKPIPGLEAAEKARFEKEQKTYEDAVVKVRQMLGPYTFRNIEEYVINVWGKPVPTQFTTYVGPAGQ